MREIDSSTPYPSHYSWGEEQRRYSFLDPLRLPPMSLPAFGMPHAEGARMLSPAGHYAAEAPQPSFHDTVDPPIFAELKAELPRPRYPAFLASRSRVIVAGYRAVLDPNGRYHLDESYPDHEQRHLGLRLLGGEAIFQHEKTGFTSTPEPHVYSWSRAGRRSFHIDEPVICLSTNEAPNYGSFIYRTLPKVVSAARLNPGLKVLVPTYPIALQDYLVIAGVERDRLLPHWVDHPHLLETAIVCSMPNRKLWLDGETIGLFHRMRRAVTIERPERRKLYVSRQALPRGPGSGQRVMLNEPEVRPALEALGFETVMPETLSPREQILAFASASTVVAAGGSALFNAVFCEPGTRFIDIEGEPRWGEAHILILASMGLEYGVFEGEPGTRDFSKGHLPFVVDVNRLTRRVREFAK